MRHAVDLRAVGFDAFLERVEDEPRVEVVDDEASSTEADAPDASDVFHELDLVRRARELGGADPGDGGESLDLDDEDLDEDLDEDDLDEDEGVDDGRPTPDRSSAGATGSIDPSDPHAAVYGRILELAAGRGALGVTNDEVAEAFGQDDTLSVAPRVSELRRFGRLVPSGLRRLTRRGGAAEVLVVPGAGGDRGLLADAGAGVDGGSAGPEESGSAAPATAWWRCDACAWELEVPVGGVAPSWCPTCRRIGALYLLPEDYRPAPRVDPPPRTLVQGPPGALGGFGVSRLEDAARGSSPFAEAARRVLERRAAEDEEDEADRGRLRVVPSVARPRSVVVDPCEVKREPLVRSPSGVDGLDHLTGGGIAEGYVVMLAGPPGAGKSTLATQAASGLAIRGTHFGAGVAYGAAEEDADAVIETADRVAIANFKIVMATSCQAMIAGLDETGAVVWVVDSLMAITADGVDGEPGLPSQINACATLLFQRAHAMPGSPYEGMPKRSIYLVAHGTKDGNMAGPLKALHSVDGGVLMEHVDPTGKDTKDNVPWASVRDQTRPTGFVSARVYRKMRKAGNRPVAYFKMQPEYLDEACTVRNPVGGRLDRVRGPG